VLELALTLGILLNLTFGTIEFGHYFFVRNTLQGAAREGARASIPPGATNTDVTTAVNSSLGAAGLPQATGAAGATVTVRIRNAADTADLDVATQTAGTAVLVKVQATWGNIGLRPLGLIASNKSVTGTAVMRKE
jgi:Flp pilus assembly protein TadG